MRAGGVSYALGAVEFVLPRNSGEITEKASELAAEGYRVLACVSSKKDFNDTELPDEVVFEGFVIITDKIRKEAPDTLRFFREQGVDVKIISGDNPETVRAVAKRAGLEKCDEIIDMSTLSTEEEIREAATRYTIFGRVLPDQKLLLVKALKAAGHTVAMTGDGVNDVLALKEADCSVAMASGSDAAKNVSSLVLMDSNFASMPRIVAEGRRSINNLERSASLYIMKTVYSVLLALLFMIVNQPLPFEPRNLTLIGGVTIGMPSIVLALEPNNNLVKGRFLTKVLCLAVPGGIVVLLGACGLLVADACFLQVTPEQLRTMYCIVTTFVGLIYLFRIALPPTIIHCVVFVAMVGIYAGCYLTDIPLIVDFFGVNNDITAEMGKAMASICAVLTVIYGTTSWFTRGLHSKIDAALNLKLPKKVAV